MGFLSKLAGKWASAKKMAANGAATNNSRFRGVQINIHSIEWCNSARALMGQRFLSDEVPMLPLEGCDANDCRCTYELFGDRRTDVRRTADVPFDIASELRLINRRDKSRYGRRRGD